MEGGGSRKKSRKMQNLIEIANFVFTNSLLKGITFEAHSSKNFHSKMIENMFFKHKNTFLIIFRKKFSTSERSSFLYLETCSQSFPGEKIFGEWAEIIIPPHRRSYREGRGTAAPLSCQKFKFFVKTKDGPFFLFFSLGLLAF